MALPHNDFLLDEYNLLRNDGFTPERIAQTWRVPVTTLSKALSRKGVTMAGSPSPSQETTSDSTERSRDSAA